MSETVGNVQCHILTTNGPLSRSCRVSLSNSLSLSVTHSAVHVVRFLGGRIKIFKFVLLQSYMCCNRVMFVVKKVIRFVTELYVLLQSYMCCNRVMFVVKKLYVL
jgi:hypothetical protein